MKSKLSKTKWRDIEGRINLAGVQYSDYQLICGNIKAGTIVQLRGVPSNPHDKLAISVR